MPLRTLVPCLVLVAVLPLGAQQPLTLQDAIALAQERGLAAQAARAARDAGRYRHRAFRMRLLPQLSLGSALPTYNYNRSIIPAPQAYGKTMFRPQDQTNATLGLTLAPKVPLTGGYLFVAPALAP